MQMIEGLPVIEYSTAAFYGYRTKLVPVFRGDTQIEWERIHADSAVTNIWVDDAGNRHRIFRIPRIGQEMIMPRSAKSIERALGRLLMFRQQA